MYFNKIQFTAFAGVLLSVFNPSYSFADGLGHVAPYFKGNFLIQLGGYWAQRGQAQDISIPGSPVKSRYTVTTQNQGSGLVGFGYLFKGPLILENFPISYGVDAIFLGQTSVSGYIVNSLAATNLAYNYKIQNIPVFFVAKTLINTNSEQFKFAFDVGIGPDFVSMSHYNEIAFNTTVQTGNTFSDRNNVAFAATAGLSLRFNRAADKIPLECGYRFFYLGEGSLTANQSRALNTIKTGNDFANAVICSVTL